MALTSGLLRSADTVGMNGRKIYNINTAKVKSRDNYNKPTEYMMGNPEGTGVAFELSQKIKHFRRSVVEAAGIEHIHELGLVTDSVFGPKDFVMEQTGAPESALTPLPLGGHYAAKMNYDPTANDAISQGWEYHNFHHTVLVADVTLLNILARVEKRLAEGKDYILLTHLNYRKLPGKSAEWFGKTERFAQLLAERHIRVLTLGQLIEERFGRQQKTCP